MSTAFEHRLSQDMRDGAADIRQSAATCRLVLGWLAIRAGRSAEWLPRGQDAGPLAAVPGALLALVIAEAAAGSTAAALFWWGRVIHTLPDSRSVAGTDEPARLRREQADRQNRMIAFTLRIWLVSPRTGAADSGPNRRLSLDLVGELWRRRPHLRRTARDPDRLSP